MQIFKSVPYCSPDSMAWGGLQERTVTRACSAPTMHLLHLFSPPAYLYPTVAHPQNESTSCIYTLNIQTEAHMGISHSTRKQHVHTLHGMDLLAFPHQVCDLHSWLLSCLPSPLVCLLQLSTTTSLPLRDPTLKTLPICPWHVGLRRERRVEHAVLQIAGEPFSTRCSRWAV